MSTSSNKFKYFTVHTVKTVKALNKTDAALAASRSTKTPNTMILSGEQWVERISAEEARQLTQSV